MLDQTPSKKEEIVFLHSRTRLDKLAFTALCCVCQKERRPLTLTRIYDDDYSRRIEACKNVCFICGYDAYLKLFGPEREAVSFVCSSLGRLWNYFGDAIPTSALAFLFDVEDELATYLPSIMFSLLFDRIGMIEAANLLAERLLSTENYDICRDMTVMDILHPPRERW